jgi:hypothetical protein
MLRTNLGVMPDGLLTTGLDYGSVDNASLNGSYRRQTLQLGDPLEGMFAATDYEIASRCCSRWSLVGSLESSRSAPAHDRFCR